MCSSDLWSGELHGLSSSWGGKELDMTERLSLSWASLVAQMVKHLPTTWETWVRSLGREDLLEKEMAVHSSILAWKIQWTEELAGCSPWSCKELDMTERLSMHTGN